MITLIFVIGIILYLALQFIRQLLGNNPSNQHMPFLLPVMLVLPLLFLGSNNYAQSESKAPKFSILTDLSGMTYKENREYTLSFEKTMNERKSFITSLGFVAKEKTDLKAGYIENTYTEVNTEGTTWLFFIPISDDGLSYEGGKPLEEVKQTTFTNFSFYGKAGYKFYSKTAGRRGFKARLYYKPEALLSYQNYKEFDVKDTKRLTGTDNSSSSGGIPLLLWSNTNTQRASYLETREINQITKGNLGLGLLNAAGVQAIFGNRLVFEFEFNGGIMIPIAGDYTGLGRGTQKENLYGRFAFNVGFAF